MGQRIKVKFLKNYIAPTGAGIGGQKDAYKVFPVTDQLQALINDGTLEVVGNTEAATRETAVVEPPEATGAAEVKSGKAQHTKKAKKKTAAE
jgi:hypothetical protein